MLQSRERLNETLLLKRPRRYTTDTGVSNSRHRGAASDFISFFGLDSFQKKLLFCNNKKEDLGSFFF